MPNRPVIQGARHFHASFGLTCSQYFYATCAFHPSEGAHFLSALGACSSPAPILLMVGFAGNPIVCLNLVKAAEKRPRETLLRTEFHTAVTYLNQGVRTHQQGSAGIGGLLWTGRGVLSPLRYLACTPKP